MQCGASGRWCRGVGAHEVALAVEFGLDATGLDIVPPARTKYPELAERFVTGKFV
jgi:hypothetical protein